MLAPWYTQSEASATCGQCSQAGDRGEGSMWKGGEELLLASAYIEWLFGV